MYTLLVRNTYKLEFNSLEDAITYLRKLDVPFRECELFATPELIDIYKLMKEPNE